LIDRLIDRLIDALIDYKNNYTVSHEKGANLFFSVALSKINVL